VSSRVYGIHGEEGARQGIGLFTGPNLSVHSVFKFPSHS
jgi:hypothetical protein